MADCFISYRRVPSSAVATALQAKLESKYRFNVYVDTTRTDGTTVRFPERLMTAIADAPVFVCLLGERDGQHTLESAWVLKEIQQAHDLGKFCIPVFQESYRPLPGMPPAVDYLLGFDGVHILDQKNIMIDDSVRQLADLIRPHRKPRRRWLWPAAILITTLVIIGILLLTNGDGGDATDDPTNVAGVGTAFLPSATPTDEPPPTATGEPSATPTDEPTPTATDEPTLTPDIIAAAQAVAAQRTAQAILDQETATAARSTQDAALNLTESANLTATATQWTRTPTPDLTASVEAVLRQWADETATQSAIDATATATLWTATATATPDPIVLARTPVTRNDDWTLVEREFDLPGGGTVTMVLVPAGCFMMGSNDGDDDEQPVREQCFDEPFWIDKYEVTNAQYGSSGYWSGDDLPRERVTWFDARDFCESRGGRLPTEAEWEYAARGPDGLVYPWGDEFVAEYVVYSGNSGGETAAVGSGERAGGRSWVGVHDLSGNVWEWVSSLYEEYPYGDNHESNTDTSSMRVLRGGSFFGTSSLLRSANRSGDYPDYVGDFGFRCARS